MLHLLILVIANKLLVGHLAVPIAYKNNYYLKLTVLANITYRTFLSFKLTAQGTFFHYTTYLSQMVSWNHLKDANYKTHYKSLPKYWQSTT